MTTRFIESDVESAALSWLESTGWNVRSGPDISPGGDAPEREDYRQVVLRQRLRAALKLLNPGLPSEALEMAYRKITNPDGATLVARNRAFHRMLVDGVAVEYRTPDGRIAGRQAKVIDFDNPENNDWLAVNQFTVVENQNNRRPDIVLFVNGLPLGILELKNPASQEATIWAAYQQLQTYKKELPNLFTFNEVLIISDGIDARVGTLTAGEEWFKPWRTISGEAIEDEGVPKLEVLIRGILESGRFLEFIRDFILFEDGREGPVKKMAGYHQFHAVRIAVKETLRATGLVAGDPRKHAGKPGDRRVGVVWHTQGSGKSMTMIFYARRISREPAMENPTIVVVTDRNDLDDQLFGMFARAEEFLGQPPIQSRTRSHLRELLRRSSGGIIFTTIQKFLPDDEDRNPVLSERRNIVVLVDEAHRSQYDLLDGLARHMRDTMPNASFIAFTGTPIELGDRNTRAIFGDYRHVYDIQQAIEDQATVPIYYESRLAELKISEEEKPKLDEAFEEVTEGEEEKARERLKSKWAQLEMIVGSENRLQLLAEDIIQHFEERLKTADGKAMIVCMSRPIAVSLYNKIVKLRPDWHHDDDDKGVIKVVMTGDASDPSEMQPHIRNKQRRQFLAGRFRDPNDPFKIVIVRDMWLTGFDCPALHTMYVDKPMRGHNLMQAIARVNRVFRGKHGGLVVDYIGIAHELKEAIAAYTAGGGRGKVIVDQGEIVKIMMEKYEVCRDILHDLDWSGWKEGEPATRTGIVAAALEHILAQPDGKERFTKAAGELLKAFSLASTHEEARGIRDDVEFFQLLRAQLTKRESTEPWKDRQLEYVIRQMISRAVVTEGVTDILEVAGLSRPDISVLSEEFLEEIRNIKHKNVAVEVLSRLLQKEIKERWKTNIVQARRFSEMLEKTLIQYRNRVIGATMAIEELIARAKEMLEEDRKKRELGLTPEELAFYDALADNRSAVEVLGDETLRTIACELVPTVRANVTIDWTIRENARAHLRRLVKRILRKYGYPPDQQETATKTVLKQAEALSEEWALTDDR
ncbi:MAG: type I restriction endonuclease subunit R [Hydrogenibacillus schlegelii]|uniref:Type I restriction enzyme endonuclease subunit n=1 Tax=Hydrogenibacillus schlegelii TaxID=1484 RepID=A0A947CUR2_HYDSH|nr:type I restriction endonuclease subunit R [Hydrogenibacillus schlegelii]